MNDEPQGIGNLVRSATRSGSALVPEQRRPDSSGGLPGLADAKAVLASPRSGRLQDCIAAVSGGVEPYTKPDGTTGYRVRTLPADAAYVLAEARTRLDALRALLSPASHGMLRTWCATLASAMETRDNADGIETTINVTASLLEGQPAYCFSRDSIRAIAQASANGGGWLPSYARIAPILENIAQPLRDEAKHLDRLVASLEQRRSDSPALLTGSASQSSPGNDPPLTRDEVQRRLLAYEAKPDKFSIIGARMLGKVLERDQPDLHAEFRDRLARVGLGAADERPALPNVKPTPYRPADHIRALRRLVADGTATDATRMRLAALEQRYPDDAERAR